ncbi:alpha/beta-hydrolase [Obba rivulosa]|uniref:Alpha/beta-hydrolase n=1 Tax=Obba rivulosa TaxID=1052685 RepID=A0A8E2ASC6_9APHY|nr:alpha/beta-hydrolase [Obba rivulosa]
MALQPLDLPDGVTSRFIPVDDLNLHILEAGDASSPLLILLHGFPELAISWRKVIVPLSEAGFRVVAPDQRGYGRTTSLDGPTGPIRFEDDLAPFRMLNLARDVVALAFALGYRTVAAVIGHDFGSSVAAHAALIRPDIFTSVILMSTPYVGPPPLPFGSDREPSAEAKPRPTTVFPRMDAQLAALSPPRKHYMQYYSGPDANTDMWHAPQGLRAFLRAYFHIKSGDWHGNDPHPLPAADAESLAALPWYYVMPLHATVAEVAQHDAPTDEEVQRNTWLTEAELGTFAEEYGRTGFQGGLNRYRCVTDPKWLQELMVFAGLKIEVPAMYLSGTKDWGVYQNPGALDKMQREACARMDKEDVVLVDGAGHWVQQEKPEVVVRQIKRFLSKVRGE